MCVLCCIEQFTHSLNAIVGIYREGIGVKKEEDTEYTMWFKHIPINRSVTQRNNTKYTKTERQQIASNFNGWRKFEWTAFTL